MKKALLLLLCIYGYVHAETITLVGNPQSAAGANWYYDGYKMNNDGSYDCSYVATFSYTPQDGYKPVVLSKEVQADSSKIEKICDFSDADSGKICVVNANVKKGKDNINTIIKINNVKQVAGKITCNN